MGKSYKGDRDGRDGRGGRSNFGRQNSGDRYQQDSGGYQHSAPARQPLKWEPAKEITKGGAQATISTAQGAREKLYNFTIGRPAINGGMPSKHMRLEDIDNAIDVLQQAKAFIQADRTGGVAVKINIPPTAEAARPD